MMSELYTANVSFRFFNGFPVLDWFLKLLKAVSWPSILMGLAGIVLSVCLSVCPEVMMKGVVVFDSCRDRQRFFGTAKLKIIDARYHDFNGFPVVNWY
jgi:hypothetical protein